MAEIKEVFCYQITPITFQIGDTLLHKNDDHPENNSRQYKIVSIDRERIGIELLKDEIPPELAQGVVDFGGDRVRWDLLVLGHWEAKRKLEEEYNAWQELRKQSITLGEEK